MYYYKTNAGKYITEEEMIGQPWILREGGGWGDRELGPWTDMTRGGSAVEPPQVGISLQ